MKTFQLHSLKIIDNERSDILAQEIPLVDGLIINREDDNHRWLIEAYIEKRYYDFFQHMNEEEVLIQVKITDESNDPAVFITTIIGLNEIGEYMNVLFTGTIIDQRKEIVQDKLKFLVRQGYQGEELLQKFKEQL